jgi:adenylosuccinate synthase
VTSSNTVAGNAAVGVGLGPRDIDYVLGITKAYTTRVGAGPFPTELFDETGKHLSRIGQEFGSVTGRARRTGWFDAVAMRRSILNNGISGLCVTKLDVMDGLERVQLCTAYRLGGMLSDMPPLIGDQYADCEPVYEEMPGWKDSTVGLRSLDELPQAARAYLARIEELCAVPVTIVSTGADRDHTIILRHPCD